MILIQYTLIYASVLILVALGGMFSERSGVINLGLEGVMVFGALGGAFTMYFLPLTTSPFVMIFLTIFISCLFGMIFSMFLAIAAINFKADQTLVGTAMNMLATAAATVIVKSYNSGISQGKNPSAIISYLSKNDMFFFKVGGVEFNIYMIITVVALVIAYIVLYKTQFGLRLMACGEHPQAAGSVGINVYKMRAAGVLISGFCGGLGGIIYISAVNSQWDFIYGVAGAGFLALAVMIFGQWKPVRIALAALFFGIFRAIADTYTGFDFLVNLVPGEIYKMFPYIISLIVLALTSGKSRAPKAEGIPYDRSMR